MASVVTIMSCVSGVCGVSRSVCVESAPVAQAAVEDVHVCVCSGHEGRLPMYLA